MSGTHPTSTEDKRLVQHPIPLHAAWTVQTFLVSKVARPACKQAAPQLRRYSIVPVQLCKNSSDNASADEQLRTGDTDGGTTSQWPLFCPRLAQTWPNLCVHEHMHIPANRYADTQKETRTHTYVYTNTHTFVQ